MIETETIPQELQDALKTARADVDIFTGLLDTTSWKRLQDIAAAQIEWRTLEIMS